jgi:hypothetical protein
LLSSHLSTWALPQVLPEVDAAYAKIRERNTDPMLSADEKDFGAEAFLESCFMLRKVRIERDQVCFTHILNVSDSMAAAMGRCFCKMRR